MQGAAVKGSLKKVESSFICRRCKGELSEIRQVNGLHIDGHEYEIVDKLCYLGDMLSQEGGCEHAILKRIQTGWLKTAALSTGKNLTFLFSASLQLDATQEWDCGGPI